MKDLHSTIKLVKLLAPVVVSATSSLSDIDLQGFNSADLEIALGINAGTTASDSHKLVFTLLHADDDGTGAAGTYALVEAKDVLGVTATNGVLLTTDDDSKYSNTYNYGYVGGKRFIKLTYTETGTVSVPMSVTLIKGHPQLSPTV